MRTLGQILSFSLCLVILQACAHTGAKSERAARSTSSVRPADVEAGNTNFDSDIDQIIAESNPVMDEQSGRSDGVPLHIPAEINERVAYWIDFFTVRDRERTVRFLERGLPLKPHIEKILRDNDMPVELFYLAMIESGFVESAKSHAKAVGVWQFMKGTGRNYDLEVSQVQDERRNWIKSTEAAASYLKDLNNIFGNWYLALASYNAGQNRIVGCITRGKTRDFWALAETKILPKETMNYVPKFLAAMIVGKNLQKYGLEVKTEDSWGPYESVSVPAGVSLGSIAVTTRVPLEELQRWNRDLIRGVTPNARGGQVDIYVPKEYAVNITGNGEALAKLRRVAPVVRYASAKRGEGDLAYYVVRSGDTLSAVSRSLNVSQRTLLKMNGLRHNRLHVGQRIKYRGGVADREPVRALASVENLRRHKVRKGENLIAIARQYGTSVDKLVRLNSLRGKSVMAGQRIIVQ